MSISALGGSGSSLVGFLQKLTGKKQSVATAGNSPANLLENVLSSAANGKVHKHGGQSALFKQIEAAVSTALSSAPSSAGASAAGAATDVNKSIQSAIATVLNNAADGSLTPDGDSGSGSTPSTSTTQSAAAGKAFSQLLQSHGVDAKQFRADFQSAIQQVQQGGVNLSKIFRNFPPGSMVDLEA